MSAGEKNSGRVSAGQVRLAAALGALTLIVLGVAAWIALRPDAAPDAPGAPGEDQGDEVRRTAAALVEEGLPGRAAELALAYLQRYPDDLRPAPVLARAQIALGELDRAERTIDSMLQIFPQYPPALWLRGELAEARGQDPMEHYAAALASPSAAAHADLYSRYGLALMQRGRAEEAIGFLRRGAAPGKLGVRARAALGEAYLLTEQPDRALAVLEPLAGDDRIQPRTLWLLGRARLAGGDGEAAVEVLRRAAEQVGAQMTGQVLLTLGQAYRQRGEWLPAGQAFAEASSYEDLPLDADQAAAECFYRAGRYAPAMKHVDRAYARRPGDPNVSRLRERIETARFGPAEP